MVSEIPTAPRYIETTHDIRISVVPEFIERNMTDEGQEYSFAYHITIENLGAEPVQLLERHWKIYSAGTQIGEVVGPGVVGHFPALSEGQSFQYTSGAVIKDPVGYMEGTYTFQGQDSRLFKVLIPRFHLLFPCAIN